MLTSGGKVPLNCHMIEVCVAELHPLLGANRVAIVILSLIRSQIPMKIVVTRPIVKSSLAALDDHDVQIVDFGRPSPSEDQLIEVAQDADALVTMLSDPIGAKLFEACPNLKLVAQYAVGYDNIDLDAARRRGVVVTNTPDVLTDATADFAFALFLAAARRVRIADQYVRDGRFARWETDLLLGLELKGKAMGIVGMGRIGRAMARRAIGFGMRIIYHNRSRANITDEKVLSARYVTMDTLLRESDAVSLHCSLTPETRHLIDRQALSKMKSTSILVNTARGAVVDESALVTALKERQIDAAGLDVFENEPRISPGLLELENVVLAPHLGSATIEARTTMGKMCAEAILAVSSGGDDVPYRVA